MKAKTHPFFISQNEQDYHPEAGCGVASLMMLLKAANFIPLPDWKSLCNQLNLTLPPSETNRNCTGYGINDPLIGLYPEDLFKFVIQSNLAFRMHFLENEWEDCLTHAPIMVMMTGPEEAFDLDPNELHWIVLLEQNKNFFTYLDPWYKHDEDYIRHISIKDFHQYYSGIALQILKK